MIKNNVFNILWFMVVGMIVTNIPCMYGAEHFDIITFLKSKNVPTDNEAAQFRKELQDLNDECKDSNSILSTPCRKLKTTVNNTHFVERCGDVFSKGSVSIPTKTKLADTCFFISNNSRMVDEEQKNKIINLIKPHLSGVTLLPLVIHENDPTLWNQTSPYKQAEFSINAIEKLNEIIIGHDMQKAEASSNLLTKNILEYLRYLNNFFISDSNVASHFGIKNKIELNKDPLINLVKITANDEIKNGYDLLKFYVPSLPSYTELLPKPVVPHASPIQSILTPDEIFMLDEAIKNPKNENYSLILNTFKKIIKIIQAPNPNTWELKNEFETISFNFLWKNAQIDKPIIQIINKLLDHKTLENIYNKMTNNDHQQIINESIAKIKSFLAAPTATSPQQLSQKPVSQFPTIATAAAVQAHHQQSMPAPTFGQPSFQPQQQTYQQPTYNQPQPFAQAPTTKYNQPVQPVYGQQQHYTPPVQQFNQPKILVPQQQQPIVIPKELTHLVRPLKRKLPQDEFEKQQATLRKNIKDLNKNLALGNDPDGNIEAIMDTLDLMTAIDLCKLTELFIILGKQGRTDLIKHLDDYKLSPPYKGLLSDQDREDILQIDRSERSFASHIITINSFFIHGCPHAQLKSFQFAVQQLANYQGEKLIPYIKNIANNNFFETMCNFRIQEPYFEQQASFKTAYNTLKNMGQPMQAATQSFAPTKTPTGTNQPATPPIPAQKSTGAVVTPGQKTATVVPPAVQQTTGAPVQQPQPQAIPNKTPAGDSEPWSFSRIVSGAWSALTSIPIIGTLFSGISSFISSFFNR